MPSIGDILELYYNINYKSTPNTSDNIIRKKTKKMILNINIWMILLVYRKGKEVKVKNINEVYNLYIKFEPIKHSNPLINLEIML